MSVKGETLIQVENLEKAFGKTKVLKGITTEIHKGEVVVIIGPSGSGKSTFLRCLNRLEQPSDGQIFFEGEDLTHMPDRQLYSVRQKMGMVFQHFHLFPHLTIQKNITLAPVKLKRMTQAEADAKATELLQKVGLADKANQYPDQLSGGERQMVAMARALMMKPSVLLLDEPSAGLSPMLQDETFIRVRQVNKAGVSVVIVEQNARRCLQICDRGYVLDQGRNAYSGKGRDLMNDPKVVSLYLGNLEEEVQEEGR